MLNNQFNYQRQTLYIQGSTSKTAQFLSVPLSTSSNLHKTSQTKDGGFWFSYSFSGFC